MFPLVSFRPWQENINSLFWAAQKSCASKWKSGSSSIGTTAERPWPPGVRCQENLMVKQAIVGYKMCFDVAARCRTSQTKSPSNN